MTTYGTATEARIAEVVNACEQHGAKAIIALAGVPGTGKSFVAAIAAQRHTNEPLLVREIQFHQSFSYEEFIEGLRLSSDAGVEVVPGVFLDWNSRALADPEHSYVLLIEELTRANLASVLGELLTYIEHRDRPFLTIYSRQPISIAKNLTVIATYNPTDRSAIELDAALIRRLRVISFPPDTGQLQEMLGPTGLSAAVKQKLADLFQACEAAFPDEYEHLMPFGHGVFADIRDEGDLFPLWRERLVRLLRRPLVEPHPFADVIEKNFPWRMSSYRVPVEPDANP